MSKDPVCGMDVDTKKAVSKGLSSDKNKKTYYFCSKNCKDKFDGNSKPEKLLNQSITIPISGMNCVSCAASIEKSLRKIKGVSKATVNFASAKAYVECNTNVNEQQLSETINKAGYKTPSNTLNLKVIGMDNPHCISIVGSALNNLKGIVSKKLLVSEKATINFNPAQTTAEKIIKQINDAGYKAIQESAKDSEKQEREKEINVLKIKVIISVILGIPLLYLAMGAHIGLPVPEWSVKTHVLAQLILTTPIIFAGYEFYTKGFRSVIKTRTANMDTLVAVGTGSAFVYSIIATVFIFLNNTSFGEKDIYFEVAGLLIAFILLGRYLEAIAKGKTSEAIKKLMGLQPKTAIIVKNGNM